MPDTFGEPSRDARRLRYDRLIQEGDELLNRGDFDPAVQHYAAAAELARDGGAGPELATALHRASVGRDRQGKLDEAAWFAGQALHVDTQFFGPVHPAVARDLHSLGVVLARGGAHAEAARELERSASISRRFQSAGELVTTLLALGQAHHRGGQAKQAQLAFSEAAEVATRNDGPQGFYAVRALLALASAQMTANEFAPAHMTWAEVTRRLAGRGVPPEGIASALATAWLGLGDLAHRARGDIDDAHWMYSFAVSLTEGTPAGATAASRLSSLNLHAMPMPPEGEYVVVAAVPGQNRVDVAHPTGGRLTVERSQLGAVVQVGERYRLDDGNPLTDG